MNVGRPSIVRRLWMGHLSVVSTMECPVSCVIFLLLCSTILPAAVGLEVVGGSVEAVVGEDLVLPCSLKPPTSAVDDEVQWLIGDQLVHQYGKGQDKPDDQLSAYRGRTGLDRDGLQRGNLSLKITSVRRSDEKTYRCFIATQTGTYEASVHVTLKDAAVVGVAGEDLVMPCSIKPSSAAEMNMAVTWYRGKDAALVHQYKNQQDKPDLQHPDYWNRTSLFGLQELQRGNASLKITSVRPTDTDKYTCEIQGQSGTIDTQYVQVEVEAGGSTPVITPVSLNNGSVNLQCDSTGWSTKPQVEWRDSRGQSLSAEPTWFQESAGIYTVMRRVIVEKSDGASFTCRVWTQLQTKEENVTVPDKLFDVPGLSTGAIVGIVVGVIAGIVLLIFWRPLWRWGNSVVWRHKKPRHLTISTESNSVHLKWQMEKCSACGTCEPSPHRRFKVTYQERDGEREPQVLPESDCRQDDTDPYKWRADLTGLTSDIDYEVTVCAIPEWKWICESIYPTLTCIISTTPKPEDRVQNGAPHDPETQPLNLKPEESRLKIYRSQTTCVGETWRIKPLNLKPGGRTVHHTTLKQTLRQPLKQTLKHRP